MTEFATVIGRGLACSLLILGPPLPPILFADQVWIEPIRTRGEDRWYPPPIEQVAAEVEAFDAERCRLVIEGDVDATTVAAHRVVWIERDDPTAAERELLAAYREGRFVESLRRLPPALQSRPPVWQQQRLSMWAASAAFRAGQTEIGLELIRQIDARPGPPLVIAQLPIRWRPGPALVDAEQLTAALTDPSPAVRLVAASRLLATDQRAEAVRVIRTISADPKRRPLRALASCLGWATATPPRVIESAVRWRGQVRKLPLVLQTGPMVLLSEKFASAGLANRAAAVKLELETTPIHPHVTD